MTAIREPVAAGRFYKNTEIALRDQIENCYTHPQGPGKSPHRDMKEPLVSPVGLVVPHAGFPYSGPVAAHGFLWLSRQGRPSTVVVIGTNHSGVGADVAIMDQGGWQTPLGKLEIDREVSGSLLEKGSILQVDRTAFQREHSVEVELPFLQDLYGSGINFVPICMRAQDPSTAKELGAHLSDLDKPDLAVIASSDFSHYEPQEVAEEKDRAALQAITSGDIDEFYNEIEKRDISICGYGPIAAAMRFANNLDLKTTELKYATSGQVAGMPGDVVGYASVAMGGRPNG